MPEAENHPQNMSSKDGAPALDTVILLAFCCLVGLASLAIFIWVITTRELFTLDNLSLVLIDLTLGAMFMANVAWSVHTGEVRQILGFYRGKFKRKPAPAQGPESPEKVTTGAADRS